MTQNNYNKIDSIIRDSLEYYDINSEKYYNFIQKIKYIKRIENPLKVEILLLDKNKNELLQSHIEILGVFFPKRKLWKWSWSIPVCPKKLTFISRKILDYALNLEETDDYLLKSKFINSSIDIVNDLQLDIHIAIASRIAKQPLILKHYVILEDDENDDIYTGDDASDNTNLENIDNFYLDISNTKSANDNYMILYMFILNYDDINV